MKVKVVHVIDSLSPGGAERVLIELVNGLVTSDTDVSVCVTRSDVTLSDQLRKDVDVLVLGRTHTWDMKAIFQFSRYVRKQKISVLHAHGRSSVLFCTLIKLLNLNRHQLIFHDHFGEIGVDQSVSFQLMTAAKFAVDYYIGVDTRLKEWAIRSLGLPESKTEVLRNCIDTGKYHGHDKSPALGMNVPEGKKIRAAMVANFRPQKDHPLLIKAIAQSDLARDLLHVFLIGDFSDSLYIDHCKKLIAENHLENNFTFMGVRNDVPEILNAVHFGILSSRSESGPIVILEYMATGIPFLATQTGEISQLVRREGHGFFCPPSDVSAFTAQLDEMLSKSEIEMRELGQRGLAIVAENFNIQKQIAQLNVIYQRLIQ